MGAVKIALPRKGLARSERAPRSPFLIFAAIVTVFLALIGMTRWLVEGPCFRITAPASTNAINPSSQAAQEVARFQRQAMRKATTGVENGANEREYYRSALRLLRRVNDIHTRL